MLIGGGALAAGAKHRPASKVSMCGRLTKAPKYKHVIVIFEENNSYNTILNSSSAPYINSVIKACGIATNYHNITHPSLPNYIGATNGAPLSALSAYLGDCSPSASCESMSSNIFTETAAKGGWKSYAESMPANCDKSNSGLYAPRHNPAVYYTRLRSCSTRDVPFKTSGGAYPLLKDFSSEHTAPAFTWITPNLCDDMHGAAGCPSNLILTGDNWLKTWLPRITSTRVYKDNDTAILVTWDEGEVGTLGESCATNTSDQSCHVVSIVIAPSVTRGTKVRVLLNHYSLLRTIEDLLRLSKLGQSKSAASMISPFNL
jgi:phosphatidylinositol-3-phosphatase